MPIDLIISPELEVARSIEKQLKAPGANEVVPFMNDNIELLNISIDDQCPLVDTKLSDIIDLFQQDEDLSKNLKASIIRKFYIMKKKIFLTLIFLLTAILNL